MSMGFQMVLGLSTNIVKSKLVRLGDERESHSLARVIGCKVVKLPIKYLRLLFEANFKEVRT